MKQKLLTHFERSPLFKLSSYLLYNGIAVPILSLIGVLFYGLRVEGKSHLKGYKSGMFASNHCQYLEGPFLAVSIFPRRLFFAAEENNVTRKDVGWLTKSLRVFGIPDVNPMQIAPFIKEALQKNWFIIFYPEGNIQLNSQEPAPFMAGVFFFSYLNDTPLFPVTEVLKRGAIHKLLPWWPPRTTLIIGEPIFPQEFKAMDLSRRDRLDAMRDRVYQIILDTIEREGGDKDLVKKTPLEN